MQPGRILKHYTVEYKDMEKRLTRGDKALIQDLQDTLGVGIPVRYGDTAFEFDIPKKGRIINIIIAEIEQGLAARLLATKEHDCGYTMEMKYAATASPVIAEYEVVRFTGDNWHEFDELLPPIEKVQLIPGEVLVIRDGAFTLLHEDQYKVLFEESAENA